MAYQPKDMTGSVFKNDRKEKDTHPDRRGDCIIDGVSYWISGWLKTDKNGNQFLSLAFKPKDAGAGAGKPTPQQQQQFSKPESGPQRARQPDGLDDEAIPF